MSEGKWEAGWKRVEWVGTPRTGESINLWMPHWTDPETRIQQQERLAAWLNHIAPDGVIPVVPGDGEIE